MLAAQPLLLCALWWNCQVNVLTYHNDLARTGRNLNETQLTPATVSSGRFAQLFSYPVDGQIYAQPLYLSGVIVPGKGIHNLVFVVTEHDSVYAFDADNNLGQPLWHVSFLDAAQNITTASAAELGCASITPEIGITATPVIDPATGTMYVVAMTEQPATGEFTHSLHAIDVTTGAERPGSPVEIQASVPGTGDGISTVSFKPWLYKERAGLLLLNGVVYTSWSSQCDFGDYHGWILGYNAWGHEPALQQSAVFADTPNSWAGAFWQAGAAPAVDTSGNIYVVSANGTFDANSHGADLGESILKLSSQLAVTDYFTPSDAAALSDQDLDLGSSGALLLPDEAGSAAHPHLLVTGSKAGTVYVVDRDSLGHFEADGDTQIVQSLATAVAPLFGIPTYFNGTVYFSGAHDTVKAFPVANGLLSAAPSSVSSETFAMLGTVPSISADGVSNGILWTIDPAGILHAYDAINLADELYGGAAGTYVKFSTPTIAKGKVYAGTAGSLAVFGLKDDTPGSVTAVVDSVNFQAGPLTPDSLVTLFGSNLAPRTALSTATPGPKALETTSVFFDGIAAPLTYASSNQINAQIPLGVRVGQVTVNVVIGDRVLPSVQIEVRAPARARAARDVQR